MAAAEALWGEFLDRRHFSCALLALAQYHAGELERALDTIERADADNLLWRTWPFERQENFADLRDHPRYQAALARARERISSLGLRPGLDVIEARAPGSAKAPLIVGFHGATNTTQSILDAWRPAVGCGWTVAAVRSTQPALRDAACWDNPAIVRRDVEAAVLELPPHSRLVVAGFSQGGGVAVEVALGGLMSARRVVAVAPAFGDLPPGPHEVRLGVHLLIGAVDGYGDDAVQAAERLREAGHEVLLDVIPELGHAYPPDFAERIPRLLAD